MIDKQSRHDVRIGRSNDPSEPPVGS